MSLTLLRAKKKFTLTVGLFLFAVLAVLSIIAVSASLNRHVDAATTKNFDPGTLISQDIFTNNNSMSASQIQSFLNKKNSTCLQNYKGLALIDANKNGQIEDWTTSERYGGSTGKQQMSAAQLIKAAADIYGINPQVLLVTLEKEQGLVTRSDCPTWRYNTAFGFGCPDTAPCDTSAYGFTRQLDNAAYHFKNYMTGKDVFGNIVYSTFKPGDRSIQFHPNNSCGSSSATITNKATAALYTYTPYQPNKASLAAGYGTGDKCSSYGNRNFHLFFNDWFGSTRGGTPVVDDITITSPIEITTNEDDESMVSFKVKNYTNNRVDFDKTVVQCRTYQGKNCDSNYGGGWYLNPGQERKFSYVVNLSDANTYKIIPYVSMYGIWHRYNTQDNVKDTITLQKPDIKITSGINLSPSYLAPRSSSAVSFQLKNTGNSPIKISKTVVQCRYNNKNCDSNYGGPATVGVNETKTFSYKFNLMDGGEHTLKPYFMVDGTWFAYNPSGNNKSSRTINVADLQLTGEGVVLSNPNPIPGQTITATYTVKNRGTAPITPSRSILQCRIDSRINCDPQYIYNDTISAGGEKTYSIPFKISSSGTYKLTPYLEYVGEWRILSNSSVSSPINLAVPKYNADMRLVGDISVSPSNATPGDTLTTTYTVKNFGDKPAYYQRSIMQCRLNTKTNCDPAYNTPDLVIQPGDSRTFTNTFKNINPGTYTFVPYFEQNNTWSMYKKGTTSANVYTKFINPITMTSPIALTSSNGTTSRVTFKVKNFSNTRVTFDQTVVQCRTLQNENCDSNYGGGWYLDPGQERTFTYAIDVSKKNTYKITPYYYKNNTWHTYGSVNSISPNKTLVIN